MCADDALVYRATSGVSFEQFQLLDVEWIDKIGFDEFSRSKWRKLSQKEKCEAAHKTVSDKSVYDEILTSTNFPKFLMALKDTIEGPTKQLDLIQKQLSVALKAVQSFDDTTVTVISKIKCISERLGIASDMTFNDHFWNTYKNYVAAAVETYKLSTDHKVFHVAMSQLIAYDTELGHAVSRETEHRKIVDEMIFLVRLQLTQLLAFAEPWQKRYSERKNEMKEYVYQKDGQWKRMFTVERPSSSSFTQYDYRDHATPHKDQAQHWKRVGVDSWKNMYTEEVKKSMCNPVTNKEDWYDLSMRDFEIAFESALLASSCKPFSLYLGREKIRMESLLRQFDSLRASYNNDPKSINDAYRYMFECIAGTYNNYGKFVPADMDRYVAFVRFKMPDQISEPEHWGHLAWMFCEYMEKLSQ
jgi:hypothetical protein